MAEPKANMTLKDVQELHYLIGRLVGLRTRLGRDINTTIYYDRYRVRIDVVPDEHLEER